MSEGMPEGINSAMLASMKNHSADTHSGASLGGGGTGVDSKVGGDLNGELSQKFGGNIDLGVSGNADELLKKYGSNLMNNPLTDIADGTLISPGNISHGGAEFVVSSMGDTSLSGVNPIKEFNMKIPRLHSGAGHEAGG